MAGAGVLASGSDVYVKQTSVGADRAKVATRDFDGKIRYAQVAITVGATTGTGTAGAVDGNDEINLFELPANARLLVGESSAKLSASRGASTTIDIGYRAYKDRGGNDVAEDVDGIVDGWDATTIVKEKLPVSAGALGTLVDVMETITFNSQGPVTIFMKALDSGGTYDGDVGDTYHFSFAYVTD